MYSLALRRLSRFHSHSLNSLTAWCGLWGHLWLPQRSEGPPFCVRTTGPETRKKQLQLACYVSVWHMIHFGGHFTLFAQRDQEFATMNFLIATMNFSIAQQLFTTRRVWYEFSIFLTSDYKKRWWDLYITPRTEYWILVSQVECWLFMRAQFSRTSNHVQCWEFKLNYSL